MTNVIVPESNHHRCTTAGMTEFKIGISQQKIPTIVVLDVLIEPDSKTVVRFFFEEQGTWFDIFKNVLSIEYCERETGVELGNILFCDLPTAFINALKKHGNFTTVDAKRNITLNFEKQNGEFLSTTPSLKERACKGRVDQTTNRRLKSCL